MKVDKLLTGLLVFGMLSMALIVPAAAQTPAPTAAAPAGPAMTPEMATMLDTWKPAQPMKPFTFGIVVKTLVNEPFQQALAESAKKTAESFGGTANYFATTHTGVAEQIAVVEDLIQKKVDGLILVPIDSNAIIAAIQEANKAGIPVVICDTASYGGDFISFIATNNISASATAADYLIKKFNGKAKVAQLEGEPGGQTAADRIKGFQDELKTAPGMELVANQNAHWTTAGGQTVTENILQAHPDLNAIFASSDMEGVGAAEAIKAAGLKGKVTLVTFDGLPDGVNLIKEGVSDADVAQFPVRMGKWGATLLAMVLSGEKKASDFPKYIDSGTQVVTADMADKFLLDTFGIGATPAVTPTAASK
jgi:ribose transport system substrate-binding protein